jgi:small subunit ribosomal protein S4e
MAHLKRHAMPAIWHLARKRKVFAVRPSPGPHPRDNCIPLQVVLRDVLHYVENAGEAKKILNEGRVLVDKKARKDIHYPLGLMDVLEIPDVKEQFRVGVNRKGLVLEKIPASEAGKKLCRIKNKTAVKGGMVQLNLHDSILIQLRDTSHPMQRGDKEILKHFRLEKGSYAVITAGRNTGVKGKIRDIRVKKSMLEKSTVILESEGKSIETLLDYVMVTGAGVSKARHSRKRGGKK